MWGLRVSGDGNGWVVCTQGHQHWGRFGAAGILITDGFRVVLQHRAPWTHEGGTWALPGGARDSHEDAVQAAHREADEETTLTTRPMWRPIGNGSSEHGGWGLPTPPSSAHANSEVDLEPANAESVDIGWWAIDEVDALPLHSGFAAAWPHLRDLITPRPGDLTAAPGYRRRWSPDRTRRPRPYRRLRQTVRSGWTSSSRTAPPRANLPARPVRRQSALS